MTFFRRSSSVPWALLATLIGCGKSDTGGDPGATAVPVGDSGTTIDASTAAGIVAFIQTDEWKAWVKEAAIHESSGPHGDVQTHFNTKYLTARRDNVFPMPFGAMAVKILYDSAALDGYAVAIKTKDGDGPSTWTWWEAFESDLPDFAFFGVANDTCEDCHSGASTRDRSLTPSVP